MDVEDYRKISAAYKMPPVSGEEPATAAPVDQTVAQPSTAKAPNQFIGAGCLIFFLVAIVWSLFAAANGYPPFASPSPGQLAQQRAEQQTQDEENLKYAADATVEDFVKERLKSPGTAKFPPTSEEDIRDLGNGKWQIDSYVDSQNSLGGVVRTNFVAIIQKNGDQWRLVDIDLKQRQ